MFTDVGVIACKAATAVHDKMKLLSSDSLILGNHYMNSYNQKVQYTYI